MYWAPPNAARAGHRELFTAAESARATAYRRQIDRQRFIVGCALTRLALSRELDVPAASVPLSRDCADCGGPHGRPRVAGDALFVSVSHSGDHVVVAVTRAGPVGVDVEQHRDSGVDVADAVLTASERRVLAEAADRRACFFGYWTRKEAVLKATGDGLRVPMTSVTVSADAELLAFAGRPELRLRLRDLDAGPGHSAALAVVTEAPIRVTAHDGERLLAQR